MRRPNAHRGPRAALGIFFALAASAAQATVYSEWQPRVAVGAGYDDNILLDGSGGDGWGQVVPGLKLYLFGDHGMRSTVDCQIGLSRLANPAQFQAASGEMVWNQGCDAGFQQRLGTRTALRINARSQYAQDPFAISNLGILLRPGQTSIWNTRLTSELSYRTSLEGTMLFGLDEYSLYFRRGDNGNGMMLVPHATYERRFTPYDTWTAGLREQVFMSLGSPVNTWAGNTTGVATSALGGYKHRFSPVTELTAWVGPALVNRPLRTDAVPVGRLEIESATPTSGVHLAVSHDLVLGAYRGGPLMGDNAEAAVFGNLTDWFVAHLRGGIYRNTLVEDTTSGVVGYSAGAGIDFRLNRAWTLGGSVGREARLSGDAIDHLVDRNVVQLRLTWEAPRTW